MRATTLALLLPAAVAGCERVTETPASPSGEDVIAAFASAYAASDYSRTDEPLPVSVSGGWDGIANPAVAAAVGKYVKEARIAVDCWATAETGTVCPGSNPWVFRFASGSTNPYGKTYADMIEVEISRRDWLHGATIWCAEVTTTGNGGWKIGEPERCGFGSYAAPGDPHP